MTIIFNDKRKKKLTQYKLVRAITDYRVIHFVLITIIIILLSSC